MLLFVTALLALVGPTWGENPAVRVTLTDKGLQYGKHAGAGWIQDKLEMVTLPDISGTIHVWYFDVDYTLSGTKIEKCDFPEPVVEFYKDSRGLKTSISGLSVSLAGEWRTQYGIIHNSGSFNMALFNVDVTTVLQLGEDADGRLSVTAVQCLAKVGSVDVKLNGQFSWLYRSAVQHHLGDIRAEIEAKICPVVNQSIVNFEHHLQTMNVSFDLNEALTLEMPLTNSTVVDASSLSLGFKGEFYSRKNHSEPPFASQPFTLALQPGYMLSLGLSEFTLNSATYGYFSAGLLQILVNGSMIPSFFPLHLNTSAMGPYVPQLPNMFPGLAMILQVYATEVPLFSFKPDSILFDPKTTVKAFAIQKNGTYTPLFKLSLGFDFIGKAWIADGKLKGSANMKNLKVTLQESEVGTFQTNAIEDLVRKGMKFAMLVLNRRLSRGMDLPRLKHAELVNTVLRMDKGFIAISSDFNVFLTEMFTDAQIGLFQ